MDVILDAREPDTVYRDEVLIEAAELYERLLTARPLAGRFTTRYWDDSDKGDRGTSDWQWEGVRTESSRKTWSQVSAERSTASWGPDLGGSSDNESVTSLTEEEWSQRSECILEARDGSRVDTNVPWQTMERG
jgi:hypothetical protein